MQPDERRLRALLFRAKHQASQDTARYTGTLAASFVAVNLAAAMGESTEGLETSLLMDEEAIERALHPPAWMTGAES